MKSEVKEMIKDRCAHHFQTQTIIYYILWHTLCVFQNAKYTVCCLPRLIHNIDIHYVQIASDEDEMDLYQNVEIQLWNGVQYRCFTQTLNTEKCNAWWGWAKQPVSNAEKHHVSFGVDTKMLKNTVMKLKQSYLSFFRLYCSRPHRVIQQLISYNSTVWRVATGHVLNS